MSRANPWSIAILLATAGGGLFTPATAVETRQTSCVVCHAELPDELGAPLQVWPQDVHNQGGLGCAGCHGGDASGELADDPELAMSPAKGYLGAPDRLEVAEFCARCHSDATLMKRFNPQIRVDQLAEYRTSVHGERYAEGDRAVATCTDCHGVHGILPVSSPDAPVYPTNVPETCGECHSDRQLMAAYGLPTDQLEEYRLSAHGVALLELGDTAAPSCNDCHGNHGAAPPGVDSVSRVCGRCHGRQSLLFRASFKSELFEDLGVPECSTCHDNHRVLHPTPELFHSGSEPRVSQGSITAWRPFAADLGALDAGQSARAEWRVVLRKHLDAGDERQVHHVAVSADGLESFVLDATVRPGDRPSAEVPLQQGGGPALSASLSVEPLSGTPVASGDALLLRLEVTAGARVEGVRVRSSPREGVLSIKGSTCLECHSPGDECDQATDRMYRAVNSLDRALREGADRLHRAEVAGMEVSEARFQLTSEGTTAAIEARALIHSFDEKRVIPRAEEGREVAALALEAGRAALDELQYRRRGLAVSLVLVLLVLIGLGLKIRQIDQQRRATQGSSPGAAGV